MVMVYPLYAIHVDHFYIVLISALKQTHCAIVLCDWKWMTVAFYSTFSVCYTFYGACAIWNCCYLTAFCVHHTTNEPHSMSSHLMQSHIHRLYACLAISITCRLHFWQRQEWNRYQNKVSTESWSRRRKVSCLDSNPPLFDHESGALTTHLAPLM